MRKDNWRRLSTSSRKIIGRTWVLGRVLTLNGKPVLALPYLKKAALLQPSAPDPHLFMADTFARLGQKANAHREQAEGQRLRGTNER